jgi:hypothetical protein
LGRRQAINGNRERGEQAVLRVCEQSLQSIGKVLCFCHGQSSIGMTVH